MQKMIVTEHTRDLFHEHALALGHSEEWWQVWCDENIELVKPYYLYQKEVKSGAEGTPENSP